MSNRRPLEFRRSALATLLALLVLAPVIAWAQTSSPDEDADLPPFMRGVMDKETYLRARAAQIDLLRGLPYENGDNPRLTAIQNMKEQMLHLGPFTVGPAWTAIGPAPIPNGQTTAFEVPVSGRTTAIAINPTNPDILYVGTAQGGVYRTLNGGASWTPLFDNAASLAIGALALAPSNPSILYVGTGEASFSCDSYFGVGLYRIDNADTSPILNGPINPLVTTGIAGTTAFTGRAISQILVLPSDPATIFVSTTSGIGGMGCDFLASTIPPLGLRGIYRSTNATSPSPTFDKLTVTTAGSVSPDVSGNRSITDMVFDPTNPGAIDCWVLGNAAIGDGGIYRTTSALAPVPAFAQVFVTTTNSSRGSFAVNRVGSTTTYLVATGESASGTACTIGAGALRSSLDGMAWSAKLPGGGGFCGGQCFYDVVVAMPSNDASLVLIGGAGNGSCSRVLARSINGGASFVGSDVNLHADCHAIAFAPSNPAIVYTGDDGGVWRSSDGGVTWNSLNNSGFSATQFQSIAVHPADRYFTIGGTQDNGTPFLRPDNTWFRADFGDGGFALIDQSGVSTSTVTMYHTYFNSTNQLIGFGRVSSTACATEGEWVFRGFGFTDGSIGCEGVARAAVNGITGSNGVLFYAPMAVGPGAPNTLYFGTDRLYRSINRGDAMSIVSQGPVQPGTAISTIGIAPLNDNIRIVGLTSGAVFATTTGSSILTNVTAPGMPAKYVGRVVSDPNNPNTAYATFCGFGVAAGQHVWKTTNLSGGAGTWVASGSGIPDVPVNAFVVDPNNSNTLYAGTDIGVYASADGGASWLPFNTGLPIVAVFDMAIQNTSRYLKIATHGRGMWERLLDVPVPTELALVGADVVGGKVRLSWYSASGSNLVATLYRRSDPGDWTALGRVTPDGDGQISYEDANVRAGGRYEYRLGVPGASGEQYFGDVWVDVPTSDALALRSIFPNPSKGGLAITFTLPSASPASVELVDVTGRRVESKEVGSMGAGSHRVDLSSASLKPGLYWVRLSQGGRVFSERASVVR